MDWLERLANSDDSSLISSCLLWTSREARCLSNWCMAASSSRTAGTWKIWYLLWPLARTKLELPSHTDVSLEGQEEHDGQNISGALSVGLNSSNVKPKLKKKIEIASETLTWQLRCVKKVTKVFVSVDKKTMRQLASQSSCSSAAAESRFNYSSDMHF